MPTGNVAYYIIALGLPWAVLVNGANVPGQLASASPFKDFSLLEAVFAFLIIDCRNGAVACEGFCFEALADCSCDLHWGIVFEGCI